MYLEDVIINGFKSYATETMISLRPGIGVIIGNNGTGKSEELARDLDEIAWLDYQRLWIELKERKGWVSRL